MKNVKLMMTTLMMCLMTMVSFGQEKYTTYDNLYDEKVNAKSQSYSTYLELVKNEKPDIYKYIKISAENKWVTDYEMIKYTIENQCKGYIEFIELYSKYENHKDKKAICINAYSEWKDGEIVDWEMVVYTIKNQLKSYGSY